MLLSYNFSTTDKGILLQNSNKSPNKELNFREKNIKEYLVMDIKSSM